MIRRKDARLLAGRFNTRPQKLLAFTSESHGNLFFRIRSGLVTLNDRKVKVDRMFISSSQTRRCADRCPVGHDNIVILISTMAIDLKRRQREYGT